MILKNINLVHPFIIMNLKWMKNEKNKNNPEFKTNLMDEYNNEDYIK